ncbi:acylglycerol kinase family protein [Brevibacillus centrosporus]|uniref:acylglycerol kinase family protein n=1 Tax=Brevibacillus centrosporus TaxID=54910 RepID=UPI0037F6777F
MIGFVVNPVAGNGKGEKVWNSLEPILRQQGVVYRVRKTSNEGEGKTLVIELIEKEEVKMIVAVGGDGTVSEVVNGIYETGKECTFGHVPAGSGEWRSIQLEQGLTGRWQKLRTRQDTRSG